MEQIAITQSHRVAWKLAPNDRRRALACTIFLAAALLSGCQTLYGVPTGAIKAPTISTSERFNLPSDCTGKSTFNYPYNEQQRNAWIDVTMGCITDNYNIFITELKRNEVVWGISTGILNLVFGVASSLTPSAGVKANYAAASLLVTGTNEVIDKEAFAERTVDALIAAMNANRSKAVVPIIRGMSAGVEDYPIALAQDHLYAFQRAGSLMEGLQFVTAQAQGAIEKSNYDLKGIPENKAIVAAELSQRGCLTAVLQGITQADQPKLFAAYRALNPGATNPATVGELAAHIAIHHRFEHDVTFDTQLIAELKRQGFTVPCGGS